MRCARLLALPHPLFGSAIAKADASPIDPVAMAVAALGMGVPILIGVLIGHPAIGLAGSVGAMWVGNAPRGATLGEHWLILRDIVLAVFGAVAMAVTIAQRGLWTDFGVVLVCGVAALVGGFSRPMAAASQRFVVFVTIGIGIASHTHGGIAWAVIMTQGALWAAACALATGVAARCWNIGRSETPPPGSAGSFRQKFGRWRRALQTARGWAYAIRLAACLSLAAAIREAFPEHHFNWIAVAVALLTQRQADGLTPKVRQRALGVAAGVLGTGLIAARPLPDWALVATIASLAALGPALRKRSYLAYTATTTPLIILLTSGSATIDQGLLIDRLIATLIAAALVIGTYRTAARLSKPAESA